MTTLLLYHPEGCNFESCALLWNRIEDNYWFFSKKSWRLVGHSGVSKVELLVDPPPEIWKLIWKVKCSQNPRERKLRSIFRFKKILLFSLKFSNFSKFSLLFSYFWLLGFDIFGVLWRKSFWFRSKNSNLLRKSIEITGSSAYNFYFTQEIWCNVVRSPATITIEKSLLPTSWKWAQMMDMSTKSMQEL